MISLIGAIGKHRELGKNNELLWDIPEDMKYFRDMTRGHVVVMGQRTYESIGRPLPDRPNIVLTTDSKFSPEGVEIVHTPEEALETAKEMAKETESSEIFVIGGAMVYSLFLEKADRLYLTLIDAEFPDADVFFPEYEHLFAKVVSERKSEGSGYVYRFMVLEKDVSSQS